MRSLMLPNSHASMHCVQYTYVQIRDLPGPIRQSVCLTMARRLFDHQSTLLCKVTQCLAPCSSVYADTEVAGIRKILEVYSPDPLCMSAPHRKNPLVRGPDYRCILTADY